MTAGWATLAGHGAAGVTGLQALALVFPLGVVVFERGGAAAAVLIAALATALAWETLFCRVRKRPQTFNAVTTAMIFAIMAPADLPFWQIAVVVSLGTIIGELIFGGRGFGFLNAGAVSLALLVFSFPGTPLPMPGSALALATVPGAALLLASGVISWRIGVAALVVLAVLGSPFAEPSMITELGVAIAVPLVFLVSDPAAAATTNHGRIAHGVLAGFLISVFDTLPGAGVSPDAVIFAALLASIFAPLLDHFAIEWNTWRRRARLV